MPLLLTWLRFGRWIDVARSNVVYAQFLRFALFGVGSGIIDFCVYRAAWFFIVSIPAAKAFGYFAGSSFSILANHRWTFGKRAGNGRIIAAFGLYIVSLGLNVTVNQAILNAIGRSERVIAGAFLAAVAVCTAFNFFGMKFFIFPERVS